MADRSPRLSPDFLLQEGVIGGLVAGAIYAAVRTAVAPLLGGSPGDPWKAFASVALWRQAVAGPLTFGVVLAGLVCHFAIAGFYGMVWGVIGGRLPRTLRDGWGSHAAAATAYGVAVYLVDVQIVARIVYPWFLDANQFAELLLHAFAYGLPLGFYLAARLRPLDRFWILAEARARARRDAGR